MYMHVQLSLPGGTFVSINQCVLRSPRVNLFLYTKLATRIKKNNPYQL